MDLRRDIFQAIADPTRRDIIHLVAAKAYNISELAEHFKVTRQAISLHVKILEECGVISITREGRERYCSLQFDKLEEISSWLDPIRETWEKRFNQLDQLLTNLNSENHED